MLDLPAVREREAGFAVAWDSETVRAIVDGLRAAPISGPAPFPVVEVRNLSVADTPVRLYRPAADEVLPLVVFFHGGGWVFGDLDTQDFACRAMSNAGRALVVSVDYGLAPEHPFPEPLHQSIRVVRELITVAASLGADPNRLILAGASSGGNLAAAVALDAAAEGWARLRGQILVYPPLDATTRSPSFDDNASGYNLSAREMRFYWHLYRGDADPRDPRLSPLYAEDLTALPPTLLFTAECDVLRDEGEEFARRLAAAGVHTYARRYDGQIHGFLGLGHISADTGHALHEIGLWIRERVW